MNTRTRNRIGWLALAVLGLAGVAVQAQNPPPAQTTAPVEVERPAAGTPDVEAPAPETPNVEAADTATDANAEEPIVWTRDRARGGRFRGGSRNGEGIVSIFGNSELSSGDRTDAVVSVFGSSTSSGEVREAVVSIFGNTRVEGGTVGEAAVAVLGDNYVDGIIDGDVVAVLGNVTLGPKADVRGNVVVIGGVLTRDVAAQIRGGVQHVMSVPTGALVGLRSWLENCARYLRPLAFAPDLGWAWTIAFGFLALYALLALLLRDPLERCVKTLQQFPGQTIVASLLATLLTPVLFTVLAITIIGIAFIPIAAFGIFVATLFGKAVVLAWIGRGLLKLFDNEDKLNAAVAVLAGGAVVLLLYVVPVLGFLVYNLLGMLAFGVVVYTLMLAGKARRSAASPPAFVAGRAPAVGGGPPPANGGPAPVGSSFASGSNASTADAAAMGGGVAAGSAAFTSEAGTSGESYAGPPPAGSAGAFAGESTGGPGSFAGATAGGAAYAAPSAAPQAPAIDITTLPRAGFWIRMLALLIDTVIVGIVLGVLSDLGQLYLVVLAAYGAVMWKVKGTTVGGIVCNLKVARLDGQPIDWTTSIVRALGCFLSVIVVGLGFIWIAFDEGRQSWHDKIAGTVVVRVPQGVSLI